MTVRLLVTAAAAGALLHTLPAAASDRLLVDVDGDDRGFVSVLDRALLDAVSVLPGEHRSATFRVRNASGSPAALVLPTASASPARGLAVAVDHRADDATSWREVRRGPSGSSALQPGEVGEYRVRLDVDPTLVTRQGSAFALQVRLVLSEGVARLDVGPRRPSAAPARDGLPFTGDAVALLAIAGATALVGGSALAAVTRRRSRRT